MRTRSALTAHEKSLKHSNISTLRLRLVSSRIRLPVGEEHWRSERPGEQQLRTRNKRVSAICHPFGIALTCVRTMDTNFTLFKGSSST